VTDTSAASALTSPFDVAQVTQYVDGLAANSNRGQTDNSFTNDLLQSTNMMALVVRHINTYLMLHPQIDGNYK